MARASCHSPLPSGDNGQVGLKEPNHSPKDWCQDRENMSNTCTGGREGSEEVCQPQLGQGGVKAAAQSTRYYLAWIAQDEKEVSSRQKEVGFRDTKQFKSK